MNTDSNTKSTKKDLRATEKLASATYSRTLNNLQWAFKERNMMLALLTHLMPGSHLVEAGDYRGSIPGVKVEYHPLPLVCLHLPDGTRASYYIDEDERQEFFAGVPFRVFDATVFTKGLKQEAITQYLGSLSQTTP